MPSSDIIQVPLNHGLHTSLYREDYERILKFLGDRYNYWFAWKNHTGEYYARVRQSVIFNGKVQRKTWYLHRLVLNAQKGEEVDHADGNSLNNLRDNLRLVSHAQNLQNRRQRKQRELPKGVQYHKLKFRATITSNGIIYNLGQYDTSVEASLAYDVAAKLLNGEYAQVNNQELKPSQELMQKVQAHIKDNGKVTHSATGYRGLSFDPIQSQWQARIRIEGKTYWLANHLSDKEYLAKIYDAAARYIFGEKAKLNFPECQDEALQKKVRAHLVRLQQRRTKTKRELNPAGYVGVCHWSKNNTWIAQISLYHKLFQLGYYIHKEQAAQAYDEGVKLLHAQDRQLNFPDQDFPAIREKVAKTLLKRLKKWEHKHTMFPLLRQEIEAQLTV